MEEKQAVPGVIPGTETDIEYVKGLLAKATDLGQIKRLTRQIALLEDAVIIYRISRDNTSHKHYF